MKPSGTSLLNDWLHRRYDHGLPASSTLADATQLYAIAAGGTLILIVFLRFLSHIVRFTQAHAAVFILQRFIYPFSLYRHRLLGPWTRGSVVFQLIYWTGNIFCAGFKVSTLADAGTRAGTLALINMILLYSGLHLSFLADMLGISVRVYGRVHGSVGVLVGALALFHVLVTISGSSQYSLHDTPHMFGLVGISSIILLLLLSFRFLRRPSYELFLRAHQALAGLIMYSVWRHTSSGGLSTRVYRYALVGSLLTTSVFQCGLVLFRNISYHQIGGRASLTRVKDSLLIDIPVVRPWKVRAGQYVNIWMPFFSLRSALQSHPFMIVYWTDGTQPSLYFLIQPQDGLTRKLYDRSHEIKSFDLSDEDWAQEVPQSCFHLAWITGPHGSGAPVGEYGSVLMVATGIGIAAQLPYLKELIWGFNHCEIRTRRIHLVWQLDFVGDEIGAVGIINQMLKDDIKDKGYIFRISIYFAGEDQRAGGNHGSEGNNARVFFHKGRMELGAMLRAMMDGRCGDDFEEGSSQRIVTERGKLLVTVSADDKVRDEIHQLVSGELRENVRLMELDFQPSKRRRFWETLRAHV